VWLLLWTCLFFQTQVEAQIIPTDGLPLPGTWENAGVEGGIPNRQVVFADVTSSPYNADNTGSVSAVSAIQAAINACPDGQVVFVPAGTYLIDGRLRINQRQITLRGAGLTTVFRVTGYSSLMIGGLGPWPPPKANSSYLMPILSGSTRGSSTVTVANTTSIPIGRMILIDENDDPALVWTKNGTTGRFRGSLHMVTSKTSNSVTFTPALPIDYTRSPQLSRHPDLTQFSGVENINFQGTGSTPNEFISVQSAWNVWISGCEFSNMPSRTIVVAWAGHVEIRRNYLHDQSNGGPNSEAIDLANDVNWSLVIDNICVAAGYPQINIGDMGANPYYSGGFGNVLAYNFCVDAYYTNPPTSTNHGMMCMDMGTNHSPHPQYNLIEGNSLGKFGVDSYHGSGSHTVLLRNAITGRNRWVNASSRMAIQIDRRNLYYALIGNVLGEENNPPTFEYVTTPGNPSGTQSSIFRLGYPDMGNSSFSGTYPPNPLAQGDGGPRDLYADRNNTPNGTTIIEGNWNPLSGVSWTLPLQTIPDSLFLSAKPAWFGSVPWPPIGPDVSGRVNKIPAQLRYEALIGIPTLTVLSPNDGEQWHRGETRQITWTAQNLTGNLVIELVQNDAVAGTIASSVAASAGSYTWTVGRLESDTFVTGTNLKIRIRTPDNAVAAHGAVGSH